MTPVVEARAPARDSLSFGKDLKSFPLRDTSLHRPASMRHGLQEGPGRHRGEEEVRPYIVGEAQWVKIRNTAYSQWEGRQTLLKCSCRRINPGYFKEMSFSRIT